MILDDRFGRRSVVVTSRLPIADWHGQFSLEFGSVKADLERRGIRIEDFDVAIAAHALAPDTTLISENIDHMGRISGLRVEGWR